MLHQSFLQPGIASALMLTWSFSTASAQPPADETIVVRRGEDVFDLTISSDVSGQVERWKGLRDRAAVSATTYVATKKGYKSYVKNFCYRYQPEEIRESLVKAFDIAGKDIEIRKRAADMLNYLGDHRGVDWATQQAEAEHDPERLRSLTKLFQDWFYYQTKKGIQPRRIEFKPGIERLLTGNLRNSKFDLRPWILCIEGDEFNAQLRTWFESGDVHYRVGIPALDELAKLSPQAWQLDLCLADLHASKDDARLTNSYNEYRRVLQRFTRSNDLVLNTKALGAYERLLLKEKDPLWHFQHGFDVGVPFSESMKRESQQRVHQSVTIDMESATDDPNILGLKGELGWERFSSVALAKIFQGTNDKKVLGVLRSRLVEQDVGTKREVFGAQFKNVNEVLAIEMVSGKPLSKDVLEYLSDTKSAVARVEYHCRTNQKTREDVFKLFHQHGFATDLNPTAMKRLFAQQCLETGSIRGWRELLGSPADVGMFEFVRGVFLKKEQWKYASYDRYIDTFWSLVDATGGEFDPKNFTVVDDKKLGKKMVGFTWRAKSFYFPFGGVTGFVPPLNAILRHEGSKNGFAQVMGRPTGGFLTSSTPKIAFGPVAVFEALETDFGFTIVSQ